MNVKQYTFYLTVAFFHHRYSSSIEYKDKCYSVLTSNTMKLNKISVGRPVPHSQLDIHIYTVKDGYCKNT